ncbi:MAG: DUF1289 domain-containing protein [Sideroxyarcus sp.]|nr:DUF1289 domain-containing protein [Sideroxyarcus sp.]
MHASEDTLEITSDSPCIGHCTTVLGDDVCRSCLRTFDEVNRWLEMSEDDRRQVNLRIALLHSNTNPPQPSLVREGAERLLP